MNRVEWPIAHDTSVLEAGIDFSSRTCALSLYLYMYHLEIFIQDESIPPDESTLWNRIPVSS